MIRKSLKIGFQTAASILNKKQPARENPMKPKIRLWTQVLIILLLAAVPLTVSASQLEIFVSILPQKYFVKRIGADRVNINVMVAPGAHPAVYEPSPKQMAQLSRADIYFAMGVPFEDTWLKKIQAANRDLKIVHTDAWIEKQPIDRQHEENNHGHDHGTKDPHIWLSPPLAQIQARHILSALSAHDPSGAEIYEKNGREFAAEIAALDSKLRQIFANLPRSSEFIVFHPSWGYFADAYDLVQIPVEISGKSPKAADLQHLITHARKKNIRVILTQPQVSSKTAQIIAKAIDGKAVSADPLAENWPENLIEVAQQIAGAAQ
jgi:zinc transport system substrate-binding protein